jgi:hypothetical protein
MSFIPCNRCKGWSAELRFEKLCDSCNNSGIIIDPKERLCNNCGECLCPLDTISHSDPHGLVNARVTGGYNSYHLMDCTSYVFSICEKCLRQLFINFKIEPTVNEVDFWSDNDDGRSSWDKDQESYEFRVWKDNGGYHQAYLNRKCNEVKDCLGEAIYTVLYHDQEYSEKCCCQKHASLYDWTKLAPNPNNYRLVPFIPDTLKAFI